jgi:hypothetical protein
MGRLACCYRRLKRKGILEGPPCIGDLPHEEKLNKIYDRNYAKENGHFVSPFLEACRFHQRRAFF